MWPDRHLFPRQVFIGSALFMPFKMAVSVASTSRGGRPANRRQRLSVENRPRGGRSDLPVARLLLLPPEGTIPTADARLGRRCLE